MKIAQIAPLMTTVPPKTYGGIEQIVTTLARGLAKRGHEVTIFAASGSRFSDRNITVQTSSPFPTFKKLSENRKWELRELFDVLGRQDDFDLIHLHYEPLIMRFFADQNEYNFLNLFRTPTVVTFHNQTHLPEHIRYYRRHRELQDFPYVFISRDQRQPLNFFTNTRVIYHGLPLDKFTFRGKPDDYLLFVGRANPVKGVREAILAAKRARERLVLAIQVDPTDRSFFNSKIKPLIDGKQIANVGEVSFQKKIKLYARAKGVLFPILWHEPFGLVMIESAACGTPVIAFNRGSAPEIIKDGKTGFVVRNVSEMVRAIKKLPLIDRQECKKITTARFSADRMIDEYLAFYRSLTKSK